MTLRRSADGKIAFSDPKWTVHDTIECNVIIDETSEVIPFHATPYDDVEEGRELFELISVEYGGAIAPCSLEERYESAAGDALSRRDSELRASDWISNGDVQLENQLEWLQYRQDLRDITLQAGYPHQIDWPTIPERTKSIPLDERINAASS